MQLDITEAQTNCLILLEAVERGEEVVIVRDGQPIAQLVAVRARQFGVFTMKIESNLLEPTDPEIIALFYES
jgi:antitoxin (DNA-binding transcriptional repressor) of toxin-antitoxin stability system